jgi:hypothetical protein
MMKTEFNKLVVGAILSESQYYSVAKIVGDKVQLNNDNGDPIVVNKDYVENLLSSADQFQSEEKKTRTELAEILFANPNVAMTVNFNKAVKAADVKAEIIAAYENSTPKEFATKIGKSVNKALDGEERTMKGRHYGNKDNNGRLNFIDMEAAGKGDTRMRLVDPRTINFIIVRGVKYIQK